MSIRQRGMRAGERIDMLAALKECPILLHSPKAHLPLHAQQEFFDA
jgi:hypothetical protein